MIDHDRHVGELLDLLDELGIADNTIVIYSTDNGPHMNTWPDAGMTPFRSEIVGHHDWLPTFLAAAGEPDIVDKLKAGHTIGDPTYKVHIDGFNLLPYLTGEVDKSPRPGFVYFSDDGDVLARTDPFERADTTSNTYYDWFIDNDYIALAATAVMTQFLRPSRSSRPARRRPASPSTRSLPSSRTPSRRAGR